MKMIPKVSIIIPVYNSDKYLEQCLNSVIEQIFKSIEIIVVNDASTDNSLEIIKKYQIKDDRIVLVNLEERRGVANARNKGLECARGEYISFVDSDDWVSKDYIEFLYENIEKEKTDMVSTSFYFYNDVTKEYKEHKISHFYCENDFSTIKQKQKLLSLLSFHKAVLWSKIYNKNFLLSNNLSFIETGGHEDELLNYEVFLLSNKLKFINVPIYFYRIGRNVSLSNNRLVLYYIIQLIKQIKKFLLKRKLCNLYRFSFFKFSIKTLLNNVALATASSRKEWKKYLFLSLKKEFRDKKNRFLYSITFIILYVLLECILIHKFCKSFISCCVRRIK